MTAATCQCTCAPWAPVCTSVHHVHQCACSSVLCTGASYTNGCCRWSHLPDLHLDLPASRKKESGWNDEDLLQNVTAIFYFSGEDLHGGIIFILKSMRQMTNQFIFPPLHSTNTFQHWQLNQCYATAVVQLTIGFICLPMIRDAVGGFAVKSYQRSFCLVSTIASTIFCHGATILSKSFHIFCKLLQATRWTVMCVVLLQLASTGPHFRLSLIHIWRCRRYSLCRSRWSPYH